MIKTRFEKVYALYILKNLYLSLKRGSCLASLNHNFYPPPLVLIGDEKEENISIVFINISFTFDH